MIALILADRLLIPCLLTLAGVGAGKVVIGGLYWLDMGAFWGGRRPR